MLVYGDLLVSSALGFALALYISSAKQNYSSKWLYRSSLTLSLLLFATPLVSLAVIVGIFAYSIVASSF